MKRANQFKVLSRKEADQVKGGGWLSSMLSAWYDRYQADKAAREAAEALASMEPAACPPPDTDDGDPVG